LRRRKINILINSKYSKYFEEKKNCNPQKLKILKIFWEEEKLISSKTQKTQNILRRRKINILKNSKNSKYFEEKQN
jgi:hypothetical protein